VIVSETIEMLPKSWVRWRATVWPVEMSEEETVRLPLLNPPYPIAVKLPRPEFEFSSDPAENRLLLPLLSFCYDDLRESFTDALLTSGPGVHSVSKWAHTISVTCPSAQRNSHPILPVLQFFNQLLEEFRPEVVDWPNPQPLIEELTSREGIQESKLSKQFLRSVVYRASGAIIPFQTEVEYTFYQHTFRTTYRVLWAATASEGFCFGEDGSGWKFEANGQGFEEVPAFPPEFRPELFCLGLARRFQPNA
jgi:hypothetical protein